MSGTRTATTRTSARTAVRRVGGQRLGLLRAGAARLASLLPASTRAARTRRSTLHTASPRISVRQVQVPAHSRLRLTRRGRFVFVGLPLMLLGTAALLLLGFFNSPAKAGSDSGALGNEAATVTVMEGETLWSIAGTVDPNRDPRDVVAEIVELNALPGSVLQPGQQLYVPASR
ncbi:MAG: peptidoglycan-binding protein [Micrococcaceae bacterium]|nr:peptidoglycan-binding protein [Micrococcaceae bacterium]